MDPGPIFNIDTSSTVTCLLAANHYLPHHTFNPLLQETDELDNLTDSLGQSLEFVLCRSPRCLQHLLRRFLPPSGSITSVSTEGNLLMCSSHLALGVPTKCSTSTLGAHMNISGAVAGEAKDVFTRGVLHFLSLYFVFLLLCFFFLVLFASFQTTQKN